MYTHYMRARFDVLADKLHAPCELLRGWLAVIDGLYSQPHRHYHNGSHVINLLQRLDKLKPNSRPGFDRFLETEIAILFHDAIYNIGAKDNEEASALLARAFLFSVNAQHAEKDRTSFVDKVQAAIMATKHDGREPDGNAARLMVDLDLAHFADPWDLFNASNKLIRAEFNAVPDEMYCIGRVNFLLQLITKPIYHVLTELEQPARANIKRHVFELMETWT